MSSPNETEKAKAPRSVMKYYVSPDVRQAVEKAEGGEVSVDQLLEDRNRVANARGNEAWREDYAPKTRAKAMVQRAPAAVFAMACTFGAIGYGLCQFIAKDSFKQQMAMRARVGFQGLSIFLFMYAAYPMIKERQEKQKDFFPTVDSSSGNILPETTKREV
eukprot:scpid81618/ scgid28733/ 